MIVRINPNTFIDTAHVQSVAVRFDGLYSVALVCVANVEHVFKSPQAWAFDHGRDDHGAEESWDHEETQRRALKLVGWDQ